MSYSAVGQHWKPSDFAEHLKGVDLSWAVGVCVHHTAFPDLSMRPDGWTVQHMRNLAHYYGKELRWSAGPHLFTDENEVFGVSPLTARGVHAVSFNARYIGVEMLGNYDRENPHVGRGARVMIATAAVVAALLDRMGLPVDDDTVKFHRDDPETDKTCPGTRINKDEFLALVDELPTQREPDEVPESERDESDRIGPEDRGSADDFRGEVETIADAIAWQVGKLRNL